MWIAFTFMLTALSGRLPAGLCTPRTALQALVRTLMVVVGEVCLQPGPCFVQCRVFVQVHLFVLYATPKALDLDVVVAPTGTTTSRS